MTNSDPDGGCACCIPAATTRATTSPSTSMIQTTLAVRALDGMAGSGIVCTLDGGADALRARVSEWQTVTARATGRRPADGGVTLTFDHDPSVTVELARLAAA